MQLDTDAILWSTPEKEWGERPLLVLMHGYGSHEGDLFSLAPALPLDAVIASVRAPIAESGGFAWFSRQDSEPGNPPTQRVDDAASAVIEWLDTLEFETVGLLGFSQGAALSLQLLRHAPDRFAATVSLSGFVAAGEHPGDDILADIRPPVFWGRGTADQVIPAAAIARTADWLPAHATLTERIYEDIGHSISTPELSDFTKFLGEHLQ